MARKKYSINWENGEAQSFEVNGVTYQRLEEVPGQKDRDKLAAILQAAQEDEAFDEDVKFNEAEFERLRKEAEDPTMERWVLGGFSVIAAVMLVIAVVSTFLNIQKLSSEESVPGIVVDVSVEPVVVDEVNRIVRDFYFPVVQYTPHDGRRREVKMSEGSGSPYYESGDQVTVAYDPDHPLDARIRSFDSSALMWILPSITGILGIAFAAAVMVVRRVMQTHS